MLPNLVLIIAHSHRRVQNYHTIRSPGEDEKENVTLVVQSKTAETEVSKDKGKGVEKVEAAESAGDESG